MTPESHLFRFDSAYTLSEENAMHVSAVSKTKNPESRNGILTGSDHVRNIE